MCVMDGICIDMKQDMLEASDYRTTEKHARKIRCFTKDIVYSTNCLKMHNVPTTYDTSKDSAQNLLK